MTEKEVNFSKGTNPPVKSNNPESKSGQSRDNASHKVRNMLGVVAAGLTVGVGWGYGVESHTNEVAEHKVVQAQYCLDHAGQRTTIDDAVLNCLRTTVPGGGAIHPDYIKRGQPIDFLDAYIKAQEHEAASIEPGRIVGWSVAPFAVAAGVVFFFGYED